MAKKINKFFKNRKNIIAIALALLCVIVVVGLIAWNMNKDKRDQVKPDKNSYPASISTSPSRELNNPPDPSQPNDPDVPLMVPKK
jgi:predicted RND superfamily exporter protein